MINKYAKTMMKTAKLWSKLSYCKRLKVGAVLAKEGRILAIGYNGTISGQDNSCEYYKDNILVTNEFVLHAEQNLISFCAKHGISMEGQEMYITHSPCPLCAKLIAQAGIKKVIYNKKYRNLEGIKFLKEVGVKVKKI